MIFNKGNTSTNIFVTGCGSGGRGGGGGGGHGGGGRVGGGGDGGGDAGGIGVVYRKDGDRVVGVTIH